MKKFILKALSFVPISTMTLGMLTLSSPASALDANGIWVKGDFHTHTYISDGSYTATEVAAKAKQFGLDWYSAADHGGATVGGRDQNGVAWLTDTTNLVIV